MCTTTWKANKDLSLKLGNVRHKRSRERGMESFMPCSRQLQYNPADAHRETNVLTTNTHTHTHSCNPQTVELLGHTLRTKTVF